jgi:hypothetical protein
VRSVHHAQADKLQVGTNSPTGQRCSDLDRQAFQGSLLLQDVRICIHRSLHGPLASMPIAKPESCDGAERMLPASRHWVRCSLLQLVCFLARFR